jgi:uncharacterized RDD family membrane protein YckC
MGIAPTPGYPQPGVPMMPAPTSGRFAGFWIRFVAYLIDSVIVGGVAFGIIKVTGAITVTCPADTVDLTTSCPGGVTTVSPLLWVVLIAGILYNPVLWGIGGTIGQRVLGLRVADANTGAAIGIGHGFLRLVGYIVASIPIYLGLIWVAFDSRKQGWHDKIASSVVIRNG